MLNLVEFYVITQKSDPFVFQLARWAHGHYSTCFYELKDGVSIKIKDKFLRVIFKPRIYV